MRSLFLSPHCDDEVLFGAFTLLKHKPRVIICFPSSGDYGDTWARMVESTNACEILGVAVENRWFEMPLLKSLHALDAEHQPDIVWAPSKFCTHPDHLALNEAAVKAFGVRLRTYETYYASPNGESIWKFKARLPRAPIDVPEWVGLKLRALAEFRSQIAHPRAYRFFLEDLHECAEQP